jgi:hypothetical protein
VAGGRHKGDPELAGTKRHKGDPKGGPQARGVNAKGECRHTHVLMRFLKERNFGKLTFMPPIFDDREAPMLTKSS